MTLDEYAALHAKEIAEPRPRQTADKKKSSLELEQEAQQAAKMQALEVYKAHQENIRKVGQLNTEILKGLQNGESLAILFLKAVKAITLCTGNTADYDIIESTLTAVYGTALHDKDVISININAVQSRLDRLNKALPEVDDIRERSRIEQAIQAHRKQLERLKQE